MKVTAYIGIGSNLGDRLANIEFGIDQMRTLKTTVVDSASPVYETEPWGRAGQPYFLNAVAAIRTGLTATDLLAELKRIEMLAGRIKVGLRWGERELDLDILIYGTSFIDSPELRIPHRHLLVREFALRPLADLAPDLVIVREGISVSSALSRCPKGPAVKLFSGKLFQ